MAVAMALNSALASADSRQGMEQIVNDSLPGVKFLANRLATRLPAHVDVEDLVQVGLMGLLQSACRFDPQRGIKFQTYANRRVEGAMLDYLRSLDWRPRTVRRRSRRLESAAAAVEQRLGENAGSEDLAAEIGLTREELQLWMRDWSAVGELTANSLQHSREAEDGSEPLRQLADSADSPEATAEKEQLRRLVAETIDRLPENERRVLSLYYYEQLTMNQIGRLLGVKQARVSQLHSQALRRLRLRLQAARKPRAAGESFPLLQAVAG